MIVQKQDLKKVTELFQWAGMYGLDTETTGLEAYGNDRLFSLILANDTESFYFNFKDYAGLDPSYTLDIKEALPLLQKCFDNRDSTWCIHNAKFDLAMLAKEGLEVKGNIHDTEVVARLIYNKHFTYSLASRVKEMGAEKSTAVEDYIKKHKLQTILTIPGKKKRVTKPHYDRVPFDIISNYGLQDGRIVLDLAKYQMKLLQGLEVVKPPRSMGSLVQVYKNEAKLVKTCLKMEQTGVRIDRDYCEKAAVYEKQKQKEAAEQFEDLTKIPFKDSARVLSLAFTKMGEKIPRLPPTARMLRKGDRIGNPTFTDAVLEGFNSPLAKSIQAYRDATKRISTYYLNFLYYADQNDFIHPNMRQAGTETGRFSYNSPNLQNIPKKDESIYPVRRAFIPPSEDYLLFFFDYDQMEYRLMLDYAAEDKVIDAVLGGLDVHQATADMVNITRDKAKTVNFALLYGSGAKLLAKNLDIPLAEAITLKNDYFEKLVKIKNFLWTVNVTAKQRKYIYNWLGRPYFFDELYHKAPNFLIQGGCSEIVKVAMNQIDDLLQDMRSRMIIQVHDELVFAMHKNELELVPKIKSIMEGVYPYTYLPLTCGVEYSAKSWADKEEYTL